MDEPLPAAPEAVPTLYRTLRARGFAVTRQERGGMGGAVIVLDGTVPGSGGPVPARVRLSGDRGQWTFEFQVEGMPDFQVPWVWEHYLDGGDLGPTDPQRQADFVAGRLGEVAAAVRANPSAPREVSLLGQNYMRRQLGMPPLEEER